MTTRYSYAIGDIARGCDIDLSHSGGPDSKPAASLLKVGDHAIIRRSDRTWRYAVVADVDGMSSKQPFIVFFVNAEGSTKKVGVHHWEDRVRPLKQLRRLSYRRSMNATYLKQKSLRSSYDTEATTPLRDSQSSLEVSHAKILGWRGISRAIPGPEASKRQQEPPGGRVKRRTSLKDRATEFVRRLSGDVERKPHASGLVHTKIDQIAQDSSRDDGNEVSPASGKVNPSLVAQDDGCLQDKIRSKLDKDEEPEMTSKQHTLPDLEATTQPQGPTGGQLKRRSSLKDKPTDFVRRLSGDMPRKKEAVLRRKQLASDHNSSVVDIKIDQRTEDLPQNGCNVSTENSEVKPSLVVQGRRPNTRRDRSSKVSFALTTSGIFKDLMKDGGVKEPKVDLNDIIEEGCNVDPGSDRGTSKGCIAQYTPKRCTDACRKVPGTMKERHTSRSTAEPNHSASQLNEHTGQFSIDGPALTAQDQELSIQEPHISQVKRRTSLKGRATELARRFSGDVTRKRPSLPPKHPTSGSKVDRSSDNFIRDEEEAPPSPAPRSDSCMEDSYEEDVKDELEMTTRSKQRNRRSNSRRGRLSSALTTSGLFKNLMKIDNDDTKPCRSSVELCEIQEECNATSQQLQGSSNVHDRQLTPTCTADARRPALVTEKERRPRSQRTRVTDARKASRIYKNAFVHLMEENTMD